MGVAEIECVGGQDSPGDHGVRRDGGTARCCHGLMFNMPNQLIVIAELPGLKILIAKGSFVAIVVVMVVSCACRSRQGSSAPLKISDTKGLRISSTSAGGNAVSA